MGSVRCLIFVGLVLSVFVAINGMDVESILEIVPKDERLDFLKYYIQRGKELSEQGVDRSIHNTRTLSDEFAILVYNYARNKAVICFDDGTCIDVGDVGVHPKKTVK